MKPEIIAAFVALAYFAWDAHRTTRALARLEHRTRTIVQSFVKLLNNSEASVRREITAELIATLEKGGGR